MVERTTLLHRATQYRQLAAVRLLLAHGADPNLEDCIGRRPLHYAASYDNMETIAEELVKHGASVDTSDVDGRRPLAEACLFGHATTARLLLQRGASPNQAGPYKQRPLHSVAIHNYVSMANDLLAHGAVVNVRDEDDKTPLDYARAGGHGQLAELLEAAKAKPGFAAAERARRASTEQRSPT
jgi:ankyrin repeat protein